MVSLKAQIAQVLNADEVYAQRGLVDNGHSFAAQHGLTPVNAAPDAVQGQGPAQQPQTLDM